MIVSTINAQEISASRCLGENYQIHFPENISELIEINEDAFILGNGTNTLFISNQKNQFVSLKKLAKYELKKNILYAEAGILLPNLIKNLKAQNIGGLEFTYPIPATLGGAIYQNFGAFDKTISDLIIEVNCFDLKNKKHLTLSKQECAFGYRHSVFKTNKYLITACLLQLENKDSGTIQNNCSTFKQKRELSHPLAYTLGSIFKNPKGFSAGKLIDDCELKGYSYKSVQICNTHANVILCNKNSKAEDFVELIKIIQTKVSTNFQIKLEPEIKIY
ncbi:MAG: UDP-N-acetylmuramate dehydrogenase [Candidatus Margulisbacteria bacterium]|nr:UDP-N-acetylmuramate dehydrogenase [Candidatus Margulisiibacteriota bacterium]